MHARIEWRDLDAVLLITKLEDHRMDFEVVNVISWEHWEDGKHRDVVCYVKRDHTSSSDNETYDLAEAERLLAGFVKWDGCAEIATHPHRDGRDHVCGYWDAMRPGRAMQRVYEYAATNMKHFDAWVANMPGARGPGGEP